MSDNNLCVETTAGSSDGPIGWIHGNMIHERRVRVLCNHFAEMIVPNATVLDVGCGDGKLASRIIKQRNDISISGIDVLVRNETSISVDWFNGIEIPFDDNSFETVTMIDVLHHTDQQQILLNEVARVARKQVVIKDHFLQGFAAQRTLELMDHVGNSRHGVDIPFNYPTPEQWKKLFDAANLAITECRESLGLYVPPLNWFFERNLHFVANLEHATNDY